MMRCSRAAITAPKRSFGGSVRVMAARPAPRHVMNGKLAVVEAETKAEKKEKKKAEEEEEEEEFDEEGEGLSPQQVESLLTILCEETDIAEVSLKLGGFRMRVRRSLRSGGAAAAAPAPVAAAPAPAPVAPAPAPAPAVSPSVSIDDDGSEAHADESLAAVTSTKVGILRRGRFVKGKQVGKGPVAEAGDVVKRGQTLCYVEQLGTHWPVEAPSGGELVRFEVEEGGPVEYKQVVAFIQPEFESSNPGFGLRK